MIQGLGTANAVVERRILARRGRTGGKIDLFSILLALQLQNLLERLFNVFR